MEYTSYLTHEQNKYVKELSNNGIQIDWLLTMLMNEVYSEAMLERMEIDMEAHEKEIEQAYREGYHDGSCSEQNAQADKWERYREL